MFVWVKRWRAARPHYCHSPHWRKERQREAKRLLSIEELKRDEHKGLKIKQMPERGLESQPVVIRFEWEWTVAGITHLCLSVSRPHRYHPSQHSSSLLGPETPGCQLMNMPRLLLVRLKVHMSTDNTLLLLKSSWFKPVCSFPSTETSTWRTLWPSQSGLLCS